MKTASSALRTLGLVATLVLVAPLAASAHDYKIGTIEIGHPWTRATPPGAPTAAGYLTIRNGGAEPDRLVEVTSTAAAKVEIHSSDVQGGVATMRPATSGLPVPAGGTVELKSGGSHLMFVAPVQPFRQGVRVKATLRFERAGSIDIELDVAALGAPGPATVGHPASH